MSRVSLTEGLASQRKQHPERCIDATIIEYAAQHFSGFKSHEHGAINSEGGCAWVIMICKCFVIPTCHNLRKYDLVLMSWMICFVCTMSH
ncbi:hypothetical protein MPTK1_6g07040 [Marchantia polymorpha subsp. ruderalis]|uniref:Uncharacterized protein n=2 Tax=Marchantia polymorpha TaxID=3197 RepID=A0AAF6BPD5_MARPO|nr:hypothetical protein MARPO_0053s0019 [Marchantia polymorpha]BBN13869.1 hypothetical protein Mp_6g07040 [Marchantia polymorpha subsp. ruderalis]|eukprot:PTQ38071.1 hypothetical protein MARPO_0053s0019 [Marchantia polymorpha]